MSSFFTLYAYAPVNVLPHPTPRGEGWGFLTFSKMSCHNPHMVQKIQCQNNKKSPHALVRHGVGRGEDI